MIRGIPGSALGHVRHLEALRIDILGAIILAQPCFGLRIALERHAEGLGDGGGGDVVMRRPDAAGRQHVIEASPALVDRRDDGRLVVGNDARLGHADADIVQGLREILEIGVARATR